MNRPSAALFDLDGTLADTMPAHFQATQQVLAPLGLELPEERFYALGGWPTRKVFELLIRESGRPLDAAALAAEKERIFASLLDQAGPIDVVVAEAARRRSEMPVAVATGATRAIAQRVLQAIGLRDWFEVVVTSEDTPRHKPEPDVFLEAARQLGVPAAGCLVYEDSDPGLEAARRAGMTPIDIRPWRLASRA